MGVNQHAYLSAMDVDIWVRRESKTDAALDPIVQATGVVGFIEPGPRGRCMSTLRLA